MFVKIFYHVGRLIYDYIEVNILPNIQYHQTGQKDASGHDVEYGIWPGTSKRQNGKVIKIGRMYLGRVIDKSNLIFFNNTQGLFRFDPSDQSFHEVKKETNVFDAPANEAGNALSTLRFGGSYFLGKLLPGIEYHTVLDNIETENPDCLNALLHCYLLSPNADMHSNVWFDKSFAKFLYPVANLCSQRISEFYEKIGKDDAQRIIFLEKHIEYVLKSTNDEYCIIIDSSACQNAWDVPITMASSHEIENNIDCRVILAVQRSTGLPLYYEIIRGNVIDSAALDSVRKTLENLGLKVSDVLTDAGYRCPSSLERLILAGSDLLVQLNPAYNLYKEAFKKVSLLHNPDDSVKRIIYRNRHVNVLKIPSVIGKDRESGKNIKGYMYLCLDEEACHEKTDRLPRENKTRKKPLTEKQFDEAKAKSGVFLIVDTRDLDEKDVLAEYYLRQAAEQFSDYATNYAKMMPVRNHKKETIAGHMMMSFIATFLSVLIKNRMNMMNSSYCAVPDYFRDKISDDEKTISIQTEKGEQHLVMVQDPLEDIFESSPGVLFSELEFIGGVTYPEKKESQRKKSIIIDQPHTNARQFLEAFGLNFPLNVEILEDGSLIYHMENCAKETCSRALAFTRPLSEEDLLKVKEEAERKNQLKQQEEAAANVASETGNASNAAGSETKEEGKENTAHQAQPHPKKRGRPGGSLNKKTLERLAAQKKMEEEGLVPPVEKRGRGRPKGSKNKKTEPKN